MALIDTEVTFVLCEVIQRLNASATLYTDVVRVSDKCRLSMLEICCVEDRFRPMLKRRSWL
jgi:hypothetical protein